MPTVLVIGDDPQIARSIATAELAWKVIHALDGLDTLRYCLAKQMPIDLIVLDVDALHTWCVPFAFSMSTRSSHPQVRPWRFDGSFVMTC